MSPSRRGLPIAIRSPPNDGAARILRQRFLPNKTCIFEDDVKEDTDESSPDQTHFAVFSLDGGLSD
jgi:hypothetical protein